MDAPADQSTSTSAPPVHSTLREAVRSPRRRRPTGAPPPLPYRLQTSGVGWLVAAVVLVGLELAVFGRGLRGAAVAVTVADDAVVRWLGGLHAPGLEALWQGLANVGSWWTLMVLWIGLVLALVVLRRWRHLIVWLVAWQLGGLVTDAVVGRTAQRARPFGVDLRTSGGGWAMPSLQITVMTAILMAVLYTLVPEGRWRNTGKWVAAGLVALVGVARVALGTDAPSDVLLAVGIGVTIPLLLFRRFTPSEVFPVTYRRGRSAHLDVGGERGVAIRRGLEDQLGLLVEEVRPFGLAGSGGSTPLRITVKGEPPTYLFAKLYALGHLRADRWYKLGRELLYGRLEDEKPFNSVRRLVQQEDYALSLMQRAGLPSPTPYGFVELTPDREYLLVTEFFDGAVELGEASVDDQVIDDGLSIIRRLWDAGLAHRDVKPANLLVRDGHLLLIDVAFVEARPTPWRQAVDLANMMLCLALRSDAERVYRRAQRQFSVEEISEGFAAARGLALPSQLRRMLRAQGRDLHAEFVGLLPTPPQPIRVQRWSARRNGLLALVAVLLAFLGNTIAGGVTSKEATKTPLYIGNLACTDLEPLWLQAQSVPSASLVPCLRPIPAGWKLMNVTVNDGRSVLTFDSDRAGTGAMVVRLTAGCAAGRGTEVAPDHLGVRRYMLIEQQAPRFVATRYDVFVGGCVTTRFSIPAETRAQLTAEAATLLDFTTRQALQRTLEQRSDGRLHLAPRNPR